MCLQDKSCSLGPNAVSSLLPAEGDVLMVGCFSGLTVSHTASLVAKKLQANGKSQPTVYICVGDRTNAQREELQRVVTAMGCKSRHKMDVSINVVSVWEQKRKQRQKEMEAEQSAFFVLLLFSFTLCVFYLNERKNGKHCFIILSNW